MKHTLLISALCCSTALATFSQNASAQTAADNAPETQERDSRSDNTIIVTAQKREQSLQDVGMSIDFASGEELAAAGITDVSQLTKLTSGFFANESIYQTPVYTIRGIGFQDSTLGAGPTVSVYTDQAPIPFSAETQGVTLDLQRVEVLKGPQGTLFGQNATGGAINYVSNLPTDYFTAGVNASIGRFWTTDVEAFVSGPISENLRVRAAGRMIKSGDQQFEYTRDEGLGKKDFLNGRFLVEFEPTEAVKLQLNVSGWRDKSEEVIPQFFGVELNGTNSVPPAGFLNYAPAPDNIRAASWDPGRDWHRNNNMLFTSLRADIELGDITLTSLSSYQDYHRYQPLEDDGTAFENIYLPQTGDIETFYQELRLSGEFSGIGNWMVGANYESDKVFDQFFQGIRDSSAAFVFGLPLGSNLDYSQQDVETYAFFANFEYPLSDRLTLLAGARYTNSKRDYEGCGLDAGDGKAAAVFEAISDFYRAQSGLPPIATIAPGGCISLSAAPEALPELERNSLKEDNISWRIGLNYEIGDNTLVYANASRGYKAGSFPTISVSFNRPQLLPVTQESVLAFEAGLKTTQADGRVSFEASAYYYDYTDKQLLGAVLDPIFGPLNGLVNVPKSHIYGVEMSGRLEPVDGLVISPMFSYVKTKIDGPYFNYNYSGGLIDFGGLPFPFVPALQGNLDTQYTFAISNMMDMFIGGNVNYASETNAKISQPDRFRLNERALIDVRAGIDFGDTRLSIWGRNITNQRYVTNATRQNDADIRYLGAPVTYGLTLNYKFR